MSYKRNANANRDALFGGGGSGGASTSGAKKKPAGAARKSTTGPSFNSLETPVPSITSSASTIPTRNVNVNPGRRTNTGTTTTTGVGPSFLSGQAKIDKMKEAEEHRAKAKKALSRTLFSSPDPIAGAMFYHRAAEAYKQCGENRLERLHRIASADCQMGHDGYATAAQEYIRAAELSACSEETLPRKKAECTKLYSDAAKAWTEAGEPGRAGECMLKSGYSMLMMEEEEGDNDMIGGKRLHSIDKDALKAIEAAVEAHVPDPLNRYRQFRQSGISAFVDPDAAATSTSTNTTTTTGEGSSSSPLEEEVSEETLDMCRSHMVKSSHAHETLNKAVQKFIEYGEFKSALYTAGAISTLLEADGFSTISLSRAYCVETILTLAIGDVVAADQWFLQVHLQNNIYLSSRECKLAEDLIRAVKMRDLDDLDTARDHVRGDNRTALSNLDFGLRNVVANLRISGAVRKSKSKVAVAAAVAAAAPSASASASANRAPAPVAAVSSSPPAPTPVSAATAAAPDDNLQDEMDDLMADMGLDDDDDDDDDDDEFDLR
mmetsp:Transcript_17281/g.26059  ORF Transcript_17281/g.26059 Transcript_17281/m.26059 type:complete len:548 (-) Transcript_17281:35-1678(-)